MHLASQKYPVMTNIVFSKRLDGNQIKYYYPDIKIDLLLSSRTQQGTWKLSVNNACVLFEVLFTLLI